MINKNIFEAIVNEFGGDYTIKEQSITKNNGVVMNGVLVTEGDSNVGMCIYLDGIDTEEEAIRVVREGINSGIKNARKLKQEIDPAVMFGRDNLLKNVYPVLVNRERNTNDDVVKTEFLNLDVIYKVDVDMDEGVGVGCVTIVKPLLKFSDVDITTLHECAINNLKGKGFIMDIHQKLFSLITGNDVEPEAGDIMNVVSREHFKFGAAVILDDDIVNKLSDIYGGKFFVLPSSIHEVITIPSDDNDDAEELLKMVKTINKEEISETDFLSDSVYRYSDGKFEVVS